MEVELRDQGNESGSDSGSVGDGGDDNDGGDGTNGGDSSHDNGDDSNDNGDDSNLRTMVMIAMTMVMIALLSPKEAQKVGDEGMGSSLPTETKLGYIYKLQVILWKRKTRKWATRRLVVKDITVL